MLLRLILGFLFCCRFTVDARRSIIDSCRPCKEVPKQKINVTITPKTFVSPQVLDIAVATPISLGDQLRLSLNIDLETKSNTQQWLHLTTIEDDFCRVVQLYVGPFAYDIETAMGIPRGACPVAKGTYHAVNYTVEFDKLKLQAMPLGKIRTIFKFIEKSSKDVVSCSVILISHTN